MLNLVQPRWFIPIHGELRHLAHHAHLAREVGIASDRVLLVGDGDTVVLGETPTKSERVTAGMTFVDGLGIGDVGEAVLRDRRKLAADGIVVVVVTVDGHTGEVLAGPDIINRGFVFEEASEHVLEEARHRVMLSLKESAAQEVVDPTVLRQHIRSALRKHFFDVTQRRPVIVPVIMEV